MEELLPVLEPQTGLEEGRSDESGMPVNVEQVVVRLPAKRFEEGFLV